MVAEAAAKGSMENGMKSVEVSVKGPEFEKVLLGQQSFTTSNWFGYYSNS